MLKIISLIFSVIPMVDAHADDYLGQLGGSPYNYDSINNLNGRGSQFNAKSVNNPYGAGSKYRYDSPNNPYGPGWKIYGGK